MNRACAIPLLAAALSGLLLSGCATSDDLLSLRQQADRDYAMDNLPGAAALYARMVHVAPGDPLLWARLGNSEALLGHPRQAARAYGEALRLKPDFASVRYNLAILRINEARAQLIAASGATAVPPPLRARIAYLLTTLPAMPRATAPAASPGS